MKSVAISRDVTKIATGSVDNKIKVWNVNNNFSLMKTLSSHSDIVLTVSFSNDNKKLISGGEDQKIKIHDISSDYSVI